MGPVSHTGLTGFIALFNNYTKLFYFKETSYGNLNSNERYRGEGSC